MPERRQRAGCGRRERGGQRRRGWKGLFDPRQAFTFVGWRRQGLSLVPFQFLNYSRWKLQELVLIEASRFFSEREWLLDSWVAVRCISAAFGAKRYLSEVCVH